MSRLPLAVPVVETARLRLVAAGAETASADAESLARLLGVEVPREYDTADVQDVLPEYAIRLREDPASLGWGPWFVVARQEGLLVSSVGFYGPASADGLVEVGYEVFAAFRGRGYATEALCGLVRWAFSQGVLLATARCEPTNAASVAVLRKAGFALVEEGEMLRWTLAASAGRAASD